ncbi:MAG: SOS response-associated peptidase [Candidatus Cloacimonetes bacterium]|nr:SOS response-associated peptidase [Candidatus Cloacimonadota bacterium]
MCGRFATFSKVEEIIKYSNALSEALNWKPSYNVAPKNLHPVVIRQGKDTVLKLMQWGLIPSWARDKTIGSKLINARGETIDTKPSFRGAFGKRHCLIPANGFFEWKKPEKQPYFFCLSDRPLFTFAGIWEQWKESCGIMLNSFTIITTEPNDSVRRIHKRMPVILNRDMEEVWLNTEISNQHEQKLLLTPYSSERMEMWQVSSDVNYIDTAGENLIRKIVL